MKTVGSILAVIILGAIGTYVFLHQSPITEQVPQMVEGEPAVTIVRTNDGYEPDDVTIKKGDIILWTNESDEYHWPASDLHPTHGVYPEFDPLVPISPGEDWKFQFNQVGEWKFHDHIRANKTGTITVNE